MSVEDHDANDCCKKSSREGCAGGVVGSLHEEANDSSRMNHNKSNRARRERKGDWPEAAQSVKVYFVRGQPETQVKDGVTGDGQPSRLYVAERNIDLPIRFCYWLLGAQASCP